MLERIVSASGVTEETFLSVGYLLPKVLATSLALALMVVLLVQILRQRKR